MNVRRSAAVLAAAVAVFGSAAAPAAIADDAKPSPSAALPSGLYGKTDPKFDGVFRQSYALLAQHTEGVEPAAKAVDWLTGQQCASGGFAAYRADSTEPCDSKTAVDSNSTAAAVQALAALGGQDKTVKKSVDWLKSVQNKDGGWGYNPGLPSDANSTGIVVGALVAAGRNPADVKSQDGKSAYDALPKLAMDCGKDGGAFGLADMKSGKLAPNADATAAGVLGSLGKGLVVSAPKKSEDAAPKCAKPDTATRAASNGVGYLLDTLGKTDDHLMSSMPGSTDQPDFGNTADSVLALAAAGQSERAKKSADWLAENSADWAKQSGPAAYSQLIFAAHAAGLDARDFGGTDLVKQLNATGPAPENSAKSSSASDADEKKDDDGGVSVWWIIGVGMVAGIGIGFLYSGNRKKKQP
ncbi:prenyltransferase/squalene oxidase repeat-containing protein [Streptomyces sp. Je 1-369]|uniref:prenyltransferase/squalene oxidase repeat-containing protein n=1 Tax=Streptomyces sp. Je 1-369 TaxID=2966192 RepID=UPI002285D708|nr:prenyltransferase/squalene oxidase repeat-containing protein [Streptomyces sp. Je 1-369]WAL95246.1 terpene cyclase/mutase family protein [Streptomyces sp. Je 1-369]